MLTKTPLAPSNEVLSNKGLEMACSVAVLARSGPDASAEPIIATPAIDITLRISAKSMLIKPGRVTISVMPVTAEHNTSSAALNASRKVMS